MFNKFVNPIEIARFLDYERDKNIRETMEAIELLIKDDKLLKVIRTTIMDKFNNYSRFVSLKIRELTQ